MIPGARKEGAENEGGGEEPVREGGKHPCERFRRNWEGSRGAGDCGDSTAQVGEEKAKVVRKSEHWGTTFVSPQRSGRCRLTGPQPRRSRGKVQGHWPHRGTGRTLSGLGSKEPQPSLPPPPAAAAAASAKPSFRHPRRRLTTCRPRPGLEPRRPPGNEY